MTRQLSPRVQARLNDFQSAVDLTAIQHREYVDSLTDGDVWDLPPAPVVPLSAFDPAIDAVYVESRWGTLGRWHAARGRYNRQVPRDELI